MSIRRVLGCSVGALVLASIAGAASDVADAAMKGNKEAVRSLIEKKTDVNARQELTPSNIVEGLLFHYNRSLAIYHCPADKSVLETSSGQKLPDLRWRSYNMSQSVNGYPEYNLMLFTYLPYWKKFSAVHAPSSSFVFIDEHEDVIIDAQFTRNGCVDPFGTSGFAQSSAHPLCRPGINCRNFSGPVIASQC